MNDDKYYFKSKYTKIFYECVECNAVDMHMNDNDKHKCFICGKNMKKIESDLEFCQEHVTATVSC